MPRLQRFERNELTCSGMLLFCMCNFDMTVSAAESTDINFFHVNAFATNEAQCIEVTLQSNDKIAFKIHKTSVVVTTYKSDSNTSWFNELQPFSRRKGDTSTSLAHRR